MNLEWFMDNVRNKPIKIHSVHKGNLGVSINTIIYDAEITKFNNGWGYCLSINDKEIELYFDDYKICDVEDCEYILNLYRNGQEAIEICLPIEDSWTSIDEIIGYAQY